MNKIVCVRLGSKSTLIRFLDKEFISLLLRKPDGVFLGLKVQIGALHAVCRRLPADKSILPPVTPLQNIPVHSPVMTVPGSRLRSRF